MALCSTCKLLGGLCPGNGPRGTWADPELRGHCSAGRSLKSMPNMFQRLENTPEQHTRLLELDFAEIALVPSCTQVAKGTTKRVVGTLLGEAVVCSPVLPALRKATTGQSSQCKASAQTDI